MWSMEITEQSLGSIRVAKQFDLEQDAVNSIDFSRDGMHMLLSTDNDAFHLYDLEWGQRMKVSYSLKYGCRNIRFTNNDSYLVHSSTKVDEWIRHMNISTNTYVHYYQGHTAKVTGLSMNPVSDMFLSTSKDRTLRLWDIRSKYTQGVMQLKSVPTATFDPEGLIFAVTVGSESVKLYDIRSFDKGPFCTFKLTHGLNWTQLSFSPCGKYIMLQSEYSSVVLIDAFTGDFIRMITPPSAKQPSSSSSSCTPSTQTQLAACFTPDSKFVFTSSASSEVCGYSIETGDTVVNTESPHKSSPVILGWNHRYFMMVTACSKLCFWSPDPTVY